jgi:glycosyltransferase involved in cell wall biosynthesis
VKKALIISYYWPPSGGGGVQRWLKFVKYMREFGWEPIVYTPENGEYPEEDLSLLQDIPANTMVIRRPITEPYTAYKKFIGQKKDEKIKTAFLSEDKKSSFTEDLAIWIRGNLFIPDARKFWIKPSVKFLNNYLKENPVDVIISTGPPHSMHMIAEAVAKKSNISWLADFRDPWTKIDFYQDLKLSSWADRKHHKLEKRVLENADRVVTIGPTLAQDFKEIHSREYEIITNGYDDADFRDEKNEFSSDCFSIVHIGSLSKTRNPETLWKVLANKVKSNSELAAKLEIRFVGKVDYSVMESLKEYGLESYVKKIDYVPHDEVIEELRKAALLLLLINDTPGSQMILTGKFFEYMSAKRPILCIGPEDGDAARILDETNSGKIAGFRNEEIMSEHLDYYFSQYANGKLDVSSEGIDQYSRRNLTKKLCDVLNGMG